ncbi:ankyrin-3 [Trichonephila inaurata madagascariensis]|uniref:Ankyrin-3 n=1 Tax=Trichonephila inaurata madagascariensis TaxID=2747483 RepID=A0A8X7CI98_9ARAC|nr:ankyrin-3 [Trichonephila inaurata madagascariensis]
MTSPESENNYDLLTISSKSRKKLLIKFKKLDEINAKHFYLNILKSIKEVVCDDNVNSLKNLCWLLEDISRIKKENDLQNYHKDQGENFNLVTLSCQKKACKVLEYLFSKRGKFLYNLIISICQKDHLLSDYDEYLHNSFYYAIRSNLVGLLHILVEKWLNDRNLEQLEDFLSNEYRELKLRRVFLTNEMEFLETIKTYIDLAISVDVTQKEGQLVVTRALQVMGEHLKNTIESPKLSDSMGKILLSSLPSNTRDVITSLRDSLSHDVEREDNTHFIRTVIEKKPQFFFKNVQQDISKIHVVIVDTLYKIKIGVIQKLMKEIGSCKQLNDVRDFFGPFRLSITSFASEVNDLDLDIAVVGDLGQLEELLSSLSSIMFNKTSYEKGLFEQINSLIQKEKERLYSVREAFLYNTFRLGDIFDTSLTGNASQMNYIHWLSKRFKKPKSEELSVSEELPTHEEPLMKIVSKLLKQIVDRAKLKIEINYDTYTILLKIVNFIKFEKGNIKWIKEFKGASDRKKRKR